MKRDGASGNDATDEPRHLAKTAWALAKLSISHVPLLYAISAQARKLISEAVILDLVNLSWSFSTWKYVHEPLLTALSAEVRRNVSEFDTRSLANTAWAFSKLGIMDARFLASASSLSMFARE